MEVGCSVMSIYLEFELNWRVWALIGMFAGCKNRSEFKWRLSGMSAEFVV